MADKLILKNKNCSSGFPSKLEEEITDFDEALFGQITSTDLTPEQRRRMVTPETTFPGQESVLAVHWHPEHIPMELAAERIAAMFPGSRRNLIIPTQHNEITFFGEYAGVEADCYSKGFNQKVQILLHFRKEALKGADRLKSMFLHTFKYRSHQLFEYMETITRPMEERIGRAAMVTGSDEKIIHFVTVNVRKIQKLLEDRQDRIPPIMIKNKLLRNFFDGLRDAWGETFIDRAQTFLNAVKEGVKAEFSLKYFYRTSEIIEEARSLGAGSVIPHPEQFWPILLKDYDVDGIEVWNPQSRRYTELLISVLNQRNRNTQSERPGLLIFMGDDTHLGEKARDPAQQGPEKASREVGLQPAWDDVTIRKTLITAGVNREQTTEAYRSRLDASCGRPDANEGNPAPAKQEQGRLAEELSMPFDGCDMDERPCCREGKTEREQNHP